MIAGSAVQKLMQTISKEQEVLMNIADIAIWTYLAESALLRVQQIIDTKGEAGHEAEIAIVKTYFYDAADKINKAGKDAIYSFADGDEARMMLMGLKRFTKTEPFNPKEARQLIATKIIEANEDKAIPQSLITEVRSKGAPDNITIIWSLVSAEKQSGEVKKLGAANE